MDTVWRDEEWGPYPPDTVGFGDPIPDLPPDTARGTVIIERPPPPPQEPTGPLRRQGSREMEPERAQERQNSEPRVLGTPVTPAPPPRDST